VRRALLAVPLALGLVACNEAEPEGVRYPELTTFKGVVVDLGGGGTLDLTVGTRLDGRSSDELSAGPAGTTLEATLDPHGVELWVTVGSYVSREYGRLELTGTFHVPTGALDVTGASYEFLGTLSGTEIAGEMLGPINDGLFIVARATSERYCGQIQDTILGVEGTLNLMRQGDALSGFAMRFNGTVLTLSGSVAGTAVALADVDDPSVTLTGTLSGNSI
jgi:hypothetical protein